MEIDGRCHCGEICYKAVVNPDNVIICHCTDCQTLSGGAFRTSVPAVEGTFVLLRSPFDSKPTSSSVAKVISVCCIKLENGILGGPLHGSRAGIFL